ncbi:hypothetical protein [Caballeronia grimmiae]|uniref:hypothetical protein n=1 Tax=Caballeronia grimmiae TaxID=1071679 RepID=UPI001FD2D7CC|nr:hypothetical protein [Caballeronia grimmiae]
MDMIESLLHCDGHLNFDNLPAHTEVELTYALRLIDEEIAHRPHAIGRRRRRLQNDNFDWSYLHLCVVGQLREFREQIDVELKRRHWAEDIRHLRAVKAVRRLHKREQQQAARGGTRSAARS